MMRHVATKGVLHANRMITPDECLEVCEFLINQSRSLHRPLDMRLLVNGVMDFSAWQEGDTGCHWKDLVATRLKERPITFAVPPVLSTRAARKDHDLEVAREIAEATSDRHERLRLWAEQTGKSEQTLYRRLQEINRA